MYRTPKNRQISDLTFFVTTVTLNRSRVFEDPKAAQVAADTLQFFRTRGEIELFGYVIMPDHVHLVVKPIAPLTLPNLMRRFKSFVARSLGNGPMWEDSYASAAIEHEDVLRQKLNYMNENPVRAGIVSSADEYRWSSARESLGMEEMKMIDPFV